MPDIVTNLDSNLFATLAPEVQREQQLVYYCTAAEIVRHCNEYLASQAGEDHAETYDDLSESEQKAVMEAAVNYFQQQNKGRFDQLALAWDQLNL